MKGEIVIQRLFKCPCRDWAKINRKHKNKREVLDKQKVKQKAQNQGGYCWVSNCGLGFLYTQGGEYIVILYTLTYIQLIGIQWKAFLRNSGAFGRSKSHLTMGAAAHTICAPAHLVQASTTASRSLQPTYRHAKRVWPRVRPRIATVGPRRWSPESFYHLFNAALVV